MADGPRFTKCCGDFREVAIKSANPSCDVVRHSPERTRLWDFSPQSAVLTKCTRPPGTWRRISN